MVEKQDFSKNQIITGLAKSPHGKLEEYVSLGTKAALQEPDFFAHLIAWNAIKGQIRDARVALPVVSLHAADFNDPELVENSLAHLAKLAPRELVQAWRFAKQIKTPGKMMMVRRLTEAYLRFREKNWQRMESNSILHQNSLRELYGLNHTKPFPVADNAIVKRKDYVPGSKFDIIYRLPRMSAQEAAGMILEKKLPFLAVAGALKEKIKEPDIALALISRMSATELVTNQTLLVKFGVKNNPAVRAAYEAALQKAAESKANLLKTTNALEHVEDEGLQEKLRSLQEKQIQKFGGVEGNWLVLGDRSPSMAHSLEAARMVAGVLTKMVKGEVYLVFFDGTPTYYKVTGKTYDEIKTMTRNIRLGSATSIGCGVQYAIDAGLEVDGIAIVSDGGENTPPYFLDSYTRYTKKFDREPTVYFYQMAGDDDKFTGPAKMGGIDIQRFDLRGQAIDYYSLPNLVQTMRASRYSLVDEILDVPLIKIEEVLSGANTEEICRFGRVATST